MFLGCDLEEFHEAISDLMVVEEWFPAPARVQARLAALRTEKRMRAEADRCSTVGVADGDRPGPEDHAAIRQMFRNLEKKLSMPKEGSDG